MRTRQHKLISRLSLLVAGIAMLSPLLQSVDRPHGPAINPLPLSAPATAAASAAGKTEPRSTPPALTNPAPRSVPPQLSTPAGPQPKPGNGHPNYPYTALGSPDYSLFSQQWRV